MKLFSNIGLAPTLTFSLFVCSLNAGAAPPQLVDLQSNCPANTKYSQFIDQQFQRGMLSSYRYIVCQNTNSQYGESTIVLLKPVTPMPLKYEVVDTFSSASAKAMFVTGNLLNTRIPEPFEMGRDEFMVYYTPVSKSDRQVNALKIIKSTKEYVFDILDTGLTQKFPTPSPTSLGTYVVEKNQTWITPVTVFSYRREGVRDVFVTYVRRIATVSPDYTFVNLIEVFEIDSDMKKVNRLFSSDSLFVEKQGLNLLGARVLEGSRVAFFFQSGEVRLLDLASSKFRTIQPACEGSDKADTSDIASSPDFETLDVNPGGVTPFVWLDDAHHQIYFWLKTPCDPSGKMHTIGF